MDIIKLTHDKLSVDEALEAVTASNCGAVSLFVGTTRDNFENKEVIQLEYEAYEPMAEKAMKQICTDLRGKWSSIENVAIFHRLGIVPVKQSSVIIAISSPHRADALQATQWCIDTLKKSVPIWKKEIYNTNESQWKENTECDWSSTENKINNKPFEIKHNVDSTKFSSHLVQINCSNEELQRRIDTFIQRKREQVNMTNIRDFCGGVTNNPNSCARVDAVLTRQKNSKSHLRMQRVYNTYGPYNVSKATLIQPFVSDAVEQRIAAVENNLDIVKPVAPDIYHRLKQIEDRILYLESVSPEYAQFWNKNYTRFGNNTSDNVNGASLKKRKFTIEDVDKYLFELQEEALVKTN